MLSLRHRLGAVATLDQGGVIAYPTESVFGYGCDPANILGVERLLSLKKRPWQKGLILVAANMQQIDFLLDDLSADELARLRNTWPGPVTWLLPDINNQIPAIIKGCFQSVAVRVSAHPVVVDLCLAWGGPLVSTSANLSGQPPFKTEYSLLRSARMRAAADYIVGGSTQGLKRPTEIREIQTGRIIRAG